jgi:hypothetical protein
MLAGLKVSLALHSFAPADQVTTPTLKRFAATNLSGPFKVLALTDQGMALVFQRFSAASFLSGISVERLPRRSIDGAGPR